MGKTREALKRAEQEYGKNLPQRADIHTKRVRPIPKYIGNGKSGDLYQNLKINLLNRYPNGSIKTIMFVGTTHGVGTSTTAVNFAKTMARNCGLSVLLLDVNLRTPVIHDLFRIDHAPGLVEFLTSREEPKAPFVKSEANNLSVLPCGKNFSAIAALFESKRFDQFLKVVREQFDYVVLDCPPLPAFPETRVICTKVDGVIMVVESGKTREKVALRVKKELEEAGANILGLVLNKRKHYIPRWIYNRL